MCSNPCSKNGLYQQFGTKEVINLLNSIFFNILRGYLVEAIIFWGMLEANIFEPDWKGIKKNFIQQNSSFLLVHLRAKNFLKVIF